MNTTTKVRDLILEMRRIPVEKAEQELMLFMGAQITGTLFLGLILGLVIGFIVTINLT